MTTGYDEEGIEELVCVEPPSGDFVPTAMCALVIAGDEGPSLTFGVGDFAIEVWLKWAQGDDSPGADVTCWLGAFDVVAPGGASNHGAAVRISATSFTLQARYDETLAGVGVVVISGVIPFGWNHFVMNYDRSGNLELVVNGTSGGTVAINANAMAATSILPYFSKELDLRTAAMVNNDDADWFGNIVSRMWQGPIAIHSRLLTDAEIKESYHEHRVQNISGVTEILWNPRDVTGQTGWEHREDYICSLDRGLLHLPFGAPEGVYGTVILPDSSGNGRDFSLPVAASYQNEKTGGLGVGSRARCCFIADPWWR